MKLKTALKEIYLLMNGILKKIFLDSLKEKCIALLCKKTYSTTTQEIMSGRKASSSLALTFEGS